LRFQIVSGGFRLQPHGELPSGELRVFDMGGALGLFGAL
jgi:hypothetical protein